MIHSSKKYKVLLGRGEPVDFVDLGILGVPAKVDTGAFRSALHATNITLSSDGITLSFEILGSHPNCVGQSQIITTEEFKIVEIENSFGHREKRYEVKLKVNVGGKVFNTGFTLANRAKKDLPILIGRTLLNKRFMVDTSITNIKRLALKIRHEPSEETGEKA